MIPGLSSLFYRQSAAVGGFSVITSVPGVSGADTAGLVVSSSVTALPQGGTAPFTYAWMRPSGDPIIAAASPTSAATTFSETLGPREFTTAVYFCRVTDAGAHVADSNFINVSLHTTGS